MQIRDIQQVVKRTEMQKISAGLSDEIRKNLRTAMLRFPEDVTDIDLPAADDYLVGSAQHLKEVAEVEGEAFTLLSAQDVLHSYLIQQMAHHPNHIHLPDGFAAGDVYERQSNSAAERLWIELGYRPDIVAIRPNEDFEVSARLRTAQRVLHSKELNLGSLVFGDRPMPQRFKGAAEEARLDFNEIATQEGLMRRLVGCAPQAMEWIETQVLAKLTEELKAQPRTEKSEAEIRLIGNFSTLLERTAEAYRAIAQSGNRRR